MVSPSKKKKKDEAPKPVAMSEMSDSFMSGTSANYLESIEREHASGRNVETSWAKFLNAMDAGAEPSKLSQAYVDFVGEESGSHHHHHHHHHRGGGGDVDVVKQDDITGTKVLTLIQAFQSLGHRMADLDPLSLELPQYEACLEPEFYDLRHDEMLKTITFHIPGSGIITIPMPKTVGQLVQELKDVYCNKIGYEFNHISSPLMKNWLLERIETPARTQYNSYEKKLILERLAQSVLFEDFLNRKFTATKRFGLDGGWSLVPGMYYHD